MGAIKKAAPLPSEEYAQQKEASKQERKSLYRQVGNLLAKHEGYGVITYREQTAIEDAIKKVLGV